MVLLQGVQTKMKLSDMAECGPGRVVQCHSRIPRPLVEHNWKTLDVSVSLKAIKLLDTQSLKCPKQRDAFLKTFAGRGVVIEARMGEIFQNK